MAPQAFWRADAQFFQEPKILKIDFLHEKIKQIDQNFILVYGKKWQCVEYVRRYYKDALNHEMPEYWGDATDYFRVNIPNGSMNTERDLVQYQNGSIRPKVNDLLVFQNMAGGLGHVSIVTNVTDSTVSTIAQNIGRDCIDVLSLDVNRIGGGCSGFLRLFIP